MTNRLPPAWSKHLKAVSRPTNEPRPGPSDNQNLVKQAAEYFRLGQFSEADRLCARILKHDPRNSGALGIAGQLAQNAGQYDLAIEYLERAVKEAPKEPALRVGLAEAYLAVHETERASKNFRRALSQKPNLIRALMGLGLAHMRANDAEQALQEFEKVLKLAPDHVSVRTHLADALVSLGRADEAVAYLEIRSHSARMSPELTICSLAPDGIPENPKN